MNREEKQRAGTLIIIIFFGLAALTGAILEFAKIINIDLAKSDVVIGQVSTAKVIRIERIGLKITTYKNIFNFQLNNSHQNFAIQRYNEDYENLSSNIKIGDTLKIYYQAITAYYNYNIYQIKKGSELILDYKNYNASEKTDAFVRLAIGIILIFIAILYYRKFNVIKFLNALAEPKI